MIKLRNLNAVRIKRRYEHHSGRSSNHRHAPGLTQLSRQTRCDRARGLHESRSIVLESRQAKHTTNGLTHYILALEAPHKITRFQFGKKKQAMHNTIKTERAAQEIASTGCFFRLHILPVWPVSHIPQHVPPILPQGQHQHSMPPRQDNLR